jgi:hypothetical protein
MTHTATDAEVTPVPVALHSMTPEVAAGLATGGPRPRGRRLRTHFDTVVVDTVSNPVRPLLPDDPDRARAVLIVHGALGGGNTSGSFGWIASSEALAGTAARGQASGAYITATSGQTVWVIEGTGAAWLAIDPTATAALSVTVFADYYDD